MTNGLVWSAEKLRFFLESSASGNHTGDGTGSYGHSATIETQYTPDSITIDGGFYMSANGASNGNTWGITYQGPGAPLGVTWTGTGWSSISGEIILTDVIVYNQGGTWKLECGYEIIVQGVSRLTGSIDTSSGGMGPAYLPGFGIPLRLYGGASATTIGLPTYADDDVYSYYSDCTSTANGGWEFDQGSGYVGLPVTITGSAPSMLGSCTDPGVADVSGDMTNNLEIVSFASSEANKIFFDSGTITACNITSYCCTEPEFLNCEVVGSSSVDNDADWEVYQITTESFSRGGNIMALPDLTREIIRFNTDYAAIWYRGEFPLTKGNGYYSCDYNGVFSSANYPVTIHPYTNEFLEEVTNTDGIIEENLLDYHSNAPWGTSGSWSKNISYLYISEPIQCGESYPCEEEQFGYDVEVLVGDWVPLPSESYSSSRSYTFPSEVGTDVIGYLGHNVAIARYINSWANPHWSYLLWNEPWELEGSPTNWTDYWEKIGQQYLYNSSLEDPSLRRNHLVSDALVQDYNQPFLDTFVAGLRWLGIRNWITYEIEPKTTHTFSSISSSLWSAKDSNNNDIILSHGASIGVGQTSIVKMRLGSWTVEPYMWSHLADEFDLNWTGIATAYLEDAWGTRFKLGSAPGTYDIGQVLSKKYAGTWAQDYGCGLIDDIGIDTSTKGVSFSVCSNAESLFTPMLSSGYSYKNLVFTTLGTATISYPTLNYTKSASKAHVKENALQDNVVHPAGTIVRFGTWNTGSGNFISIPPDPASVDLRPDLPDWLTQVKYSLEGKTETDSPAITTLLTDWFTSYEGESIGAARNGAYAFWLPSSTKWLLAVVNSAREIPPISTLPYKKRDLNWEKEGDYSQTSYHWAQNRHLILSTSENVELREPNGITTWTSSPTEVVTGWQQYEWDNSLANDEVNFGVWDVKKKAILRPWRGFCYFPNTNTIQRLLSSSTEDSHELIVGWWDTNTTVDYKEYWSNLQELKSYSNTGTETGSTKINERFYNCSFDGSNLKIYRITDMISSISTTDGTCPVIAGCEDGELYLYWLENGEVFHARIDTIGTVLQSRISCGIVDVEDGGLTATITETQFGKPMTALVVLKSGVLEYHSSTNGYTF